MRYTNVIFIATAMLVLAGCASLDCKPNSGSILQGTNTAVVGLYIDKNSYPQATVDTVKVHPGQKIVFIGPDKFDIIFKDQKSPIRELEIQSSNGVVTIEIPKDIFERQQKTTAVEIKELIYRYGIRVNGKVTDPTIIITRE